MRRNAKELDLFLGTQLLGGRWLKITWKDSDKARYQYVRSDKAERMWRDFESSGLASVTIVNAKPDAQAERSAIIVDDSDVVPVSMKLGAAWRLVERTVAYAQEKGLGFGWPDFAVYGGQDDGAEVFVVDFCGGRSPGRAVAETLPLAICRAAESIVDAS